MHRHSHPAATLPAAAGIGLRSLHHRQVLEAPPDVGWLEVHSENFFAAGGEPLRVLEAVRERYPVSLHGVGLSLGSADELSRRHLEKLKALAERIEPAAISEHLCWSSVYGRYLNDLLPLPYTREALDTVCARVSRTQDFLGRAIMVENVSSYLRFAGAEIPEWDFVAAVARRTGCGILLDVNNIYVSARNHGFDAQAYLAAIPADRVWEIHLAGYEEEEEGGLLVDTHSRPVYEPVWQLYAQALARFGPVPTLIEWDNDIPALATLVAEADKAERLLGASREARHARAA
ncbi:MAG TPA: DUF692 domain-containing protein [Rhodocyclaceae bacterium]|nr:DUF692 domain-containing protein [Rhodocyclaceae bacterium]